MNCTINIIKQIEGKKKAQCIDNTGPKLHRTNAENNALIQYEKYELKQK